MREISICGLAPAAHYFSEDAGMFRVTRLKPPRDTHRGQGSSRIFSIEATGTTQNEFYIEIGGKVGKEMQ